MAAGNTYVALATQTLGSSAASVTFSSISGAYTDLILVCSIQGTATTDLALQFNSDTGSNYSSTQLYGTGTAAGSARPSSPNAAQVDFYGYIQNTNFTVNTIHIMNYSNTTTYKTVLSRANQASNGTNAGVSLWRSTSAITSVKAVLLDANSFATGSTFSLYGIAAA